MTPTKIVAMAGPDLFTTGLFLMGVGFILLLGVPEVSIVVGILSVGLGGFLFREGWQEISARMGGEHHV